MAKVNFYLKDNQTNGETNINLFFSYSSTRFKWFTGQKISPKDWSFLRKRARRNPELNRYLDNLAERTMRIHAELLSTGNVPTPEQIKVKLNEAYRELPEDEYSLIGFLEKFIESNPTSLADNTLRQYRTLKSHLLDFISATGYRLSFDTITVHFDQAFYEYLISKEKPLGPSSINKLYGILKNFLTYATRKGYNTNMVYKTFERKRKKSSHIALTESEVQALKLLELSGSAEFYRDVFIFSCETAMEYSAVAKLKPSDIHTGSFEGVNDGKEITYAEYHRSKTSQKVTPPLNAEALALIDKYADPDRNTCFPKLTNQVYNRTIKALGKQAGITDTVEVIEYHGAEKVTKTYPRHELISSHTGRRTFVTLFIERGGTNEACRVYTGHATNRQLDEYRKDTLQHKMALAFQKSSRKPRMEKVS